MSLIKDLLKSYRENVGSSDSGLHSGQRMTDKDGKLKADPSTDGIDNVNFKDVDGSPKQNKADFDKEVQASVKGTKPAE